MMLAHLNFADREQQRRESKSNHKILIKDKASATIAATLSLYKTSTLQRNKARTSLVMEAVITKQFFTSYLPRMLP